MSFLGTLLLFGGYTLIYAATAKGGVFATEPWNGVFTDAYGNVGGQIGQTIGTDLQTAVTRVDRVASTASTFSRPRPATGFTG